MIERSSHRALVRVCAEAPEVCILDIGLPGMDGNELARQLRSDQLTTQPVLIALTGYGDDNNRKNSLDAGFDHYLVKPVDMEELTALLNELIEVLAGSGVFGSSITTRGLQNSGWDAYVPIP